jgi:hypothetical protein
MFRLGPLRVTEHGLATGSILTLRIGHPALLAPRLEAPSGRHATGPFRCALVSGRHQGATVWLWWKTFAGSHWRLTWARRS